MRLTPLDIKKQDFKRVMRGVDAEEVQAFLQMVADQWQDLIDDQNKLEHKITELETKLDHYKQVEEALQEAVKTARESSRQTLDAAKAKAKSIIDAAADSAERLQHKATEDQYELRRDIDILYARRREAITRLRNLLRSELDMLEDFDQQYPIPVIPEPVDEFESDVETETEREETLEMETESEQEGNAEPVDLTIPSDAPAHDEAREEFEAVQDIEELEAVAASEEHHGGEDSDYAEDTLMFTAEDGVDGQSENTAESPAADNAAQQAAAESSASSGESFRDSKEMDKIRKILDDLA
ncbi:MAG: DivIVA domain-containing protein [Rhodothermales bacterium]|nr:DivIVA domain-containing protein [Rhodothermales bacterium]